VKSMFKWGNLWRLKLRFQNWPETKKNVC
jgi:hypothetical protein